MEYYSIPINGVTRHVSSDRLKRLVENEILVKTPYKSRIYKFYAPHSAAES
mgnify:CR=1 FL=1